jgi:hypothetical protein
MAFEIDIGFTSLAGGKAINEDFAAAMLPEAGQVGMGAIAAIADGVSTGGMGKVHRTRGSPASTGAGSRPAA